MPPAPVVPVEWMRLIFGLSFLDALRRAPEERH
jgi:hypothetical protein